VLATRAMPPMTTTTPSVLDRLAAWTSPRLPSLAIIVGTIALGVAVMLDPLIGLALTAVALVGVGVLAFPDFASPLVAFVLYSNVAVIAIRFHGVPRFVGAAIPLLLVVPILHRTVVQRERFVVPPVVPLLFLLLSIQLLGVLFAREPAESALTVLTFLTEGIALFVLFTNSVRSEVVLRRTIWGLLFAGLLIGAVPAVQRLTGTFYNDYGGLAQVNTDVGTPETFASIARSSGPIGDENRYAQIMLMLVPFGVLCFANSRRRSLRLLAAVCLAFAAIGFVLAVSRGGAVALLMVLLALPALGLLSVRKLGWVAVVLALMVAVTPQYRRRIISVAALPHLFSVDVTEEDEPDGAMKGRATEMLAAAYVFIDYPLIGVGPGMFPYYSQEYGNQLGIRRLGERREAHSLYLDIAAENGALGLLLFLAIAALTLQRLHRARKLCASEHPDLSRTAAATFVALLSYLATGVFLHFSYQRYYFLVLALAWSVILIAERAAAEDATGRRALERA